MYISFHHFFYALIVPLLLIIRINSAEAWIWSTSQDETATNMDADNMEETELTNGGGNVKTDVEGDVLLLEEEDVENEQNLRCSKHFNRNLYRFLKSVLPLNMTDRMGRQDDADVDEGELVQSALDLEASQIIGPVLRIVGSAAAANATAIDEHYNQLPLVIKYDVANFLKFAVDLLTTT